jgi:hypothetical protein
MAKSDKIIHKILQGDADSNIKFDDLRALLKRLGFEERVRGSHHIFRRADIMERLNLQCEGANAKPYQVRQLRTIILKYKLRS